MKTKCITLLLLLIISLCSIAQEKDSLLNKLPSIELKHINGKTINTTEISNNGNPILICIWKSCCKSPVNMLDAIAEVYDEWKEETGVLLYAISIDDARSSNHIAPFINGKGWEFEVLLDPNSDFKRAMNVSLTPHTFLLNGDGKIVWQKAMFLAGEEEEIYKKILEIINN